MHLMRGFSGGTMPEGTDKKEGMPFYLGAFLAVALEWRTQARNAVLQAQTLQALETRVAGGGKENPGMPKQGLPKHSEVGSRGQGKG